MSTESIFNGFYDFDFQTRMNSKMAKKQTSMLGLHTLVGQRMENRVNSTVIHIDLAQRMVGVVMEDDWDIVALMNESMNEYMKAWMDERMNG